MAKYERSFTGDFTSALARLNQEILNGSASASFESGSDFIMGDTRCALRVYERYSMIGSNRVSLSIMLMGKGNQLRVSAITSGGSQAMLFKINTFGEEAFLDTVREVINRL